MPMHDAERDGAGYPRTIAGPAPALSWDTGEAVTAPRDRPLVSIVVPCFNTERFVRSAVESALAQTYSPVEVIAIDDASTDGTTDVLGSFGSSIRWERFPVNLGPSAARNRGMHVARGEYIQFLDADDLLHPEKVEECMRAYAPGVDLVFTENAYFLDFPLPTAERLSQRAMQWFRCRPMAWDPERAAEYVLRREVQTATPLHRTEYLRRSGGFLEHLWSLEDVELHFRLAIGGARMRKVERVLVHCRHHGDPARLRTRPGRFLVSLAALDEMHRTLMAGIPSDDGVRAALADQYANIGRKLLWEGDPAEAARAFDTARRLSPVPRPTGFPLYNWISRVVGVERLEAVRRTVWRSFGGTSSTPPTGDGGSPVSAPVPPGGELPGPDGVFDHPTGSEAQTRPCT
jgi:glycosyltransferase involved in cell wall biosynthesis